MDLVSYFFTNTTKNLMENPNSNILKQLIYSRYIKEKMNKIYLIMLTIFSIFFIFMILSLSGISLVSAETNNDIFKNKQISGNKISGILLKEISLKDQKENFFVKHKKVKKVKKEVDRKNTNKNKKAKR